MNRTALTFHSADNRIIHGTHRITIARSSAKPSLPARIIIRQNEIRHAHRGVALLSTA